MLDYDCFHIQIELHPGRKDKNKRLPDSNPADSHPAFSVLSGTSTLPSAAGEAAGTVRKYWLYTTSSSPVLDELQSRSHTDTHTHTKTQTIPEQEQTQ